MRESENELPKYFFKYLSLGSKENLIRVCDIFFENHIYLPNKMQLNDPFEGQSDYLSAGYGGFAGVSIYAAADMNHPVIEEEQKKYKILSLSSDGFSPQLWAYYAGNYEGLCICFKSEKSFSIAKKINYVKERTNYSFDNMIECFYEKGEGWKYEKEWRIIKKTDDSFFRFDREEIACVIFGERINSEVKSHINKCLDPSIMRLDAHTGMRTFNIYYQPMNYMTDFDGSLAFEIRNDEELSAYLSKQNKK